MTLFGVSVVGFRNEGGINDPGGPANDWAVWERAGLVPSDGPGCELWREPARALDHAAACGAEVVALGVEWARVEPRPDRVDPSALEGYARILDLCAERAMAPVVVLHDISHPEWLGEEFWLTPGSPERFRDHVARVVAALGTRCRHWVTLRQPNLVALAGWVGGHHPPRRIGAVADAWAVLDNLLSAHVLAYDAVHAERDATGAGGGGGAGVAGAPGGPADPVVLMGVRTTGVYDWGRLAVDLVLAGAAAADPARTDRWLAGRRARHDAAVPPRDTAELALRRAAAALSPFGHDRDRRRATADRVAALLGARGERVSSLLGPPPSPRRVLRLLAARAGAGAPLDALFAVARPPAADWAALPGAVGRAARERQRRAWGPAAPAVWCRDQRQLTPDLPLWVEDGFPSPGGARPAVELERAAHLRAAMAEVASLGGTGRPVDAYLYHSLAGVGDPTTPEVDAGLYGVSAGAGGGLVWDDAGTAVEAFRKGAQRGSALGGPAAPLGDDPAEPGPPRD